MASDGVGQVPGEHPLDGRAFAPAAGAGPASLESVLRTLFDQGPVAIYSCDAAGTIQEYNAAAAALWGREPRRGDPTERFCGSRTLYLPDGTPLPYDRTPVAAVLKGELPFVRDAEVDWATPSRRPARCTRA